MNLLERIVSKISEGFQHSSIRRQINELEYDLSKRMGKDYAFVTMFGEKYQYKIDRKRKKLRFFREDGTEAEFAVNIAEDPFALSVSSTNLGNEEFLLVRDRPKNKEGLEFSLYSKDGNPVFNSPFAGIDGFKCLFGYSFVMAKKRQEPSGWFAHDGTRLSCEGIIAYTIKDKIAEPEVIGEYVNTFEWIERKFDTTNTALILTNPDQVQKEIINKHNALNSYFESVKAIADRYSSNPETQKSELLKFFKELTSYVDSNPKKFMEELRCRP